MKETLIAIIAVAIAALLQLSIIFSIYQPTRLYKTAKHHDRGKLDRYTSDKLGFNGTLSMLIISPKGDFLQPQTPTI